MGAVEDVELLRDRLRAVRESYVKAVILFGSRARGNLEGGAMLTCLFFMKAVRSKIGL